MNFRVTQSGRRHGLCICRHHFSFNDVSQYNARQSGLVCGLHQFIQNVLREFGESFIDRSEDGERTRAFDCLCQAGDLDDFDERFAPTSSLSSRDKVLTRVDAFNAGESHRKCQYPVHESILEGFPFRPLTASSLGPSGQGRIGSPF